MSLLADLLAGKGLDPDYARAATRRRAAPARDRGIRRGRFLAVMVAIGMLGAVAVVQVRRAEPVAQRQRERLVAEIRDRTAETDLLQRRVDDLRSQTERRREQALVQSTAGRRARADLSAAAAAAAARPVSGAGVRVTVDDAPHREEIDFGAADSGRIYDRDLQKLVNGLWATGATAIAVNGQRLTATTAIRSAGEAVLVDYRPLSPPYAVTALGDPEKMQVGFVGSVAGRHFRRLQSTFGIRFDIRPERAMRLPAATGLRLRHAREGTSS